MQDNESLSMKNVLRGLHFQNPPHAQGKLVRVIKGSVLDVVVDLRKNSKGESVYDLSKVTVGLGWDVREEKKGFLTDNYNCFHKCFQYVSLRFVCHLFVKVCLKTIKELDIS
mgnify:CR=1 FL=1